MSSIIPGYEYDIFISYRQKDNKYDGWVTEFVGNLKRELESAFKEEISVYFDINSRDGLLETHDVDASLEQKIRCLICIPIISRTYCDPKSFAWEHEFKTFLRNASGDQFGLKVRLPGGNFANRVLPVRIHDIDPADVRLFEATIGSALRSVDFVYKEPGVNRQLREKDDDIIKSPGQILYRDQINKVALAAKDIIDGMKNTLASTGKKDAVESEKIVNEEKIAQEAEKTTSRKDKPGKGKVHDIEKEASPDARHRSYSFYITILLALMCAGAGFYFLYRNSRVKWAKEKMLPVIEKSFNDVNTTKAFDLLQEASKYISEDSVFKSLKKKIVTNVTFITDPSGAEIYARDYSDTTRPWKKIGTTPLSKKECPTWTFLRVKFFKPGYDTVYAVTSTNTDTLLRKLKKTGETPPGMVYVDGFWDETKNTFDRKLGFFIDKYEVTNKQYKDFIDRGGYNKKEFWKNKFVKEGKTLSWEEAIALFKDKTGRPGPSTWEAGSFPEGQENYPVSGVSWYEAAAYAEFAGKELPSAESWDSSVGFFWPSFSDLVASKVSPLSNFNGKNTRPAGRNEDVTAFGAYDLAGNVREWCWNETTLGRIFLGGGFEDATYTFVSWNQLPPFDRSGQNGFRCVKYIEKDKIPASAFELKDIGFNRGIDFSTKKPVSEEIFRVFCNQFQYDKTDLNPVVEKRYNINKGYRIEKVTFNTAYDNDRMTVYLYLPLNSKPPYQTLIFFPGSYAIDLNTFNIDASEIQWFFPFLLNSGRAVAYPVVKGTYERHDGPDPDVSSHQYVDRIVKMTKDISRTIDYFGTRGDIDTARIGYYGHSWGAMLGAIIPAVEKRFKANILVVGGFIFYSDPLPEANQVNYLPRNMVPTLMLNGRYDFRFPEKTNLRPFFNLLGAPPADKKLCIYETDHYVSKTDMVREVSAWLDKYFGPVRSLDK